MAARLDAEAASCAVQGSAVATIESIFNDKVSLAVLQRPVLPEVSCYLERCPPPRHGVENRRAVSVAEPDAAAVFSTLPDAPGRDALIRDYLWMLELFATVADCESIGIRMAITPERTCPRFHVDQVSLRLICTWQGPGTEWLEHTAVERRFLGHGSRDLPDEASGLIHPGERINSLGAFDIGFMKGEAWPGNAGRGLVHRSPPPNSLPRVMISMDALY
jgi:hypothetical protein